MQLQQTRRKKTPDARKALEMESVDTEWLLRRLRKSAGTEMDKGRDPTWALGESFSQVFDFVGRQRTLQAFGAGENPQHDQMQGTSMLDKIGDDHGRLLRRFSEHAFTNGRLASAVLMGQGANAFHACVQRSGAYGIPKSEVRRKIDKTADNRRIPQTDDRVHFGDDPHAAVAIAMQATRTASQALKNIQRAATLLEGHGVDTLRELFPFLFTEEEDGILSQLHAKRRQGGMDEKQAQALDSMIRKTQAAKDRKLQMRTQFLNKLEKMLANAREAEQYFAKLLGKADVEANARTQQDAQPGSDDNDNGETAGGPAKQEKPEG